VSTMNKVVFRDKEYEVDDSGFLIDPYSWDEDFATGMAPTAGIDHGLSSEHWKVIRFIRETYEKLGRCPLVYQTCKLNSLRLRHLQKLFPTGYLRGACKLAGVTYRSEFVDKSRLDSYADKELERVGEKSYEVDVKGFLIDFRDWDEDFAIHKCHEMKMPQKLGERHWQIIKQLREIYMRTDRVPNVYEACSLIGVELEELELLFPDGYQRGAVKLAGLRVR